MKRCLSFYENARKIMIFFNVVYFQGQQWWHYTIQLLHTCKSVGNSRQIFSVSCDFLQTASGLTCNMNHMSANIHCRSFLSVLSTTKMTRWTYLADWDLSVTPILIPNFYSTKILLTRHTAFATQKRHLGMNITSRKSFGIEKVHCTSLVPFPKDRSYIIRIHDSLIGLRNLLTDKCHSDDRSCYYFFF